MGLDPLTIGLGLLTAGSAASSYRSNKKAAAENKEAGRINQASQQVEAARQRRQAARSARIRRAQILQSAENTGVGGSSGEQASIASLLQQAAGVDSYLAGSEVAATAISNKTQNAAENQFKAQVASSLANISGQLAFNESAKQTLRNIF